MLYIASLADALLARHAIFPNCLTSKKSQSATEAKYDVTVWNATREGDHQRGREGEADLYGR